MATRRAPNYDSLREADAAHEDRRAINATAPSRVSREFVARISQKLQAAIWVIAFILLFVYGGVSDVMFDPERSSP